MSGPWQVWVDTGGTFTDCIALAPDGSRRRAKVLSSGALRGTILGQTAPTTLQIRQQWGVPTDFIRGLLLVVLGKEEVSARVTAFDAADSRIELATALPDLKPDATFEVRFAEEPPLVAARLVTGTPPGEPLPPLCLRLATTRGTNALLTRSGVPPAFFVTRGFADVLEIGTQQRPDLFTLDIVKPEPLSGPAVEVEERLNADGTILHPLNEGHLREAAERLVAAGVTTAAVSFLHTYRNPVHEERAAEILRAAGFKHISRSAELAPFIKHLPRTQTAVVNAYLAPIIGQYLGAVATGLSSESTVHVMSSAGGMVRAAAFQPKDSLLSGPAGGIVGAALSGQRAGYDRVIAFDMGGTSTDVARYEGDAFEYTYEHGVGDARLLAPALAIESVAAGGGSVCLVDRGNLRVGPESAGAFPGPACYGAGGPLTVTDVNLLLGRLLPDRFDIPLSLTAAEAAAQSLFAALGEGRPSDPDAILEGLLEIANERMADAIRRISVRRGYDPSDYAMVSFGGAGGQHACAVAGRLGIRTVVAPPDASLLSAWGIGHASLERFAELQVLRLLEDIGEAGVEAVLDTLTARAVSAVVSEGVAPESVFVARRTVALRLFGQESSLEVVPDDRTSLRDLFVARYKSVYGHPPSDNRSIEVESIYVVARSREGVEDTVASLPPQSQPHPLPARVTARFCGVRVDTPIYERSSLAPTDRITGPALVVESHSVIVVEPGWNCRVEEASRALVMEATVLSPLAPSNGGAKTSSVTEELFAARFAAIAEEMGEQLRRTALSTNVKERLDFSCALLSRDGTLVASAAHIPVHLGAMGICVRAVRDALPPLEPGDVVITNHPAFGGSHLPDVTVITPVFDETQCFIGYVANRAHHAEIGGTRPGSMPPNARTLAEEGVVLPPTYLMRAGESRLDEICRLLAEAPYPSRAIAENRADLEAALAANRQGEIALQRLARQYGPGVLEEQMKAQQERAERLLRLALGALPEGDYAATEYLDDGSPISVRIRLWGSAAEIDFSRTSGTHAGNLNAPPAVTASAVLYVLRLLVGEPLPLNEGLLRPVTLRVPEDCLLNPRFDPSDANRCPAVVGGNVETSQRVVDTLLRALGMAAGSQGTMNNLLFGNERFGYYETVCGGAGATSHAPGASAVHTHMTNTRITDVEILEHRYPVRVERFAVRQGSGGTGQHRGGAGVVREITFLEPVSVSVLTQHRKEGPYGMAGGEPGVPGRQRLVRADGTVLELGAVGGCEVLTGDRLVLETPGGGGWGTPASE